jgi:hypothetical protein
MTAKFTILWKMKARKRLEKNNRDPSLPFDSPLQVMQDKGGSNLPQEVYPI